MNTGCYENACASQYVWRGVAMWPIVTNNLSCVSVSLSCLRSNSFRVQVGKRYLECVI